MKSSVYLRNIGQWVIACALGLYFTAEVGQLIVGLWWAILLSIVWALAIGFGFGLWLQRQNAKDMPELSAAQMRATSYFAGAIGGASEMAIMADRHKARTDLVAASHSMRLVLVVLFFALWHAVVSVALGLACGHSFCAGSQNDAVAGYLLFGIGHECRCLVHDGHQTQQSLVHGPPSGLHGFNFDGRGVDGHSCRNVQHGAAVHWGEPRGAFPTSVHSNSSQMVAHGHHWNRWHDVVIGCFWWVVSLGDRFAPGDPDSGHITWRHCRNGHHSQSVGIGSAYRDCFSGVPPDGRSTDCGTALPVGGRSRQKSVNHHGLLGQAGVTLEGVFDFLLGGCVLLPSLDVHLEHFCPGAI